MAKYLINDATLQGIADAIRAKTGTSGTLKVTDFASEISRIEGGGGECSGVHINIVDELPETGNQGDVVALKGLADVVVVENGEATLMKSIYEQYGYSVVCITTTQEAFTDDMVSGDSIYLIYFTDIPDIYGASPGATAEPFGMPFKGEITDISEVDTTQDGCYAYIGVSGLYKYTNGFKQLVTKGGLVFTSNGDGTCYLSNINGNHDMDIVIPRTSPAGDTVTEICMTFADTFFRSITIPDTVTSIDSFSFSDNFGLGSIEIPDSVTRIGDGAFEGCRALKTAKLPANLTVIENQLFNCCPSLKEVTLGSSITTIRNTVFSQCYSLSTINFGGTMDQWNAITKGSHWRDGVPATKVTCSDGEVALTSGSSSGDSSGGTTEVTTEEITITPTDGVQEITPTNADYFSKVTVEAIPSEYVKPSGTLSITENGTADVTTYSAADVSIPEFDGTVVIE